MKDSPGFHFKTYLFLFFIVLFAPLGNVLLGKGMKDICSAKNWTLAGLFPVFVRILTSGYVWLGIACLLAFFISYMLVPPASSFSYAVVAILGYLLLGETVTRVRWAGIAIICAGVFIVGRTHPRSTERS